MGWRKGTENSTEMQAAWQQGSSVGERPCGKGMHPHSRRAQPTHFFPLPFHQRNTESGQGLRSVELPLQTEKEKNHLQALSTQR